MSILYCVLCHDVFVQWKTTTVDRILWEQGHGAFKRTESWTRLETEREMKRDKQEKDAEGAAKSIKIAHHIFSGIIFWHLMN